MNVNTVSTTKICRLCKKALPVANFGIKDKPSGRLQPRCKKCTVIFQQKSVNKRKEAIKIYAANFYKKNKEQIDKNNREWIAANPERVKELGRRHFQTPGRKLRHKINQAKRRAIKLHATIPGFEKEIAEIYKNCPSGYHVDHIMPLRGKESCGLHVPWNLQYLTPLENMKKGNRT